MADLSWSGALGEGSPADRARAVVRKAGLACCGLGALEVLLGVAGFPGILSGVAHLFLAYALLQHASRSAAVALFAEASLSFFVGLSNGNFGGRDVANMLPAAAQMLVGALAVVSTWVYHRAAGSRAVPGNVVKKSAAAAVYAFLVQFMLALGARLAGLPVDPSHSVTVAFLLYAPTLTVLAAALEGRLPLTRDLPFTVTGG